jgi:hypothetical protein
MPGPMINILLMILDKPILETGRILIKFEFAADLTIA